MLAWLKYAWMTITAVVGYQDWKKNKEESKTLTPQKILKSLEQQNDFKIPQLKLEPVPWRKDTWLLIEDWSYGEFFIPKYFFCDLDSVPRLPYIYSFFKGYARTSAGVHDWLYATEIAGRKGADRVFYELMRHEGVHPIRAKLVYAAVRAFGWLYYGKKRGVWASLMAPEVRNADHP